MNRRLGKKDVRLDCRTLKLANYVTALPAPPTKCSWAKGVPQWPMYANDRLGDCTIAAAGHMQQLWSEQGKPYFEPPLQKIVDVYNVLSPGDDGCVELDVLNYWRKKGIAGRKITAYASVAPRTTNHVELAVDLFGAVYSGLSLPLSAQSQKVWQVTGGSDATPGSWGGHAVPIVAYNSTYLTCVTWGKLLKMTWAFWHAYADEAYAVLDQSWLGADKVSPGGFNVAQLLADAKAL